MKITRKAGKVALAGAIAFGGLGLGAVSDVPVPGLKTETASAATNESSVLAYDGWNGVTFSVMQENVQRGGYIDSVIARASYTTGATLGGILFEGSELNFTSDQVMLYEITADGSLKRWKTILPTRSPSNWGKAYQYVTLITSTYPKGDYVAIHTYTWTNDSGLDPSTFEEYKEFKIN